MSKVFENVKTIGLRLELEGDGIVNADSGDQKDVIIKLGLGSNMDYSCKNYQFAKKNFYKDEEGNPYFKYKISSECLRHEVFKETMPDSNPLIKSIPQAFYPMLAMPDYIIRGICIAEDKDNSVKSKSKLTLTDAEEVTTVGHNYVPMEIHTRAGYKKTGDGISVSDDEEKKKDTTVYNIEVLGHKNYESHGFINLSELQFIPDDPMFDRMSLAVEDGSAEAKIYLDALRRNMVNLDPSFRYYTKKGRYGGDEVAERGILLNQESVNMIVKRTLKGILDIQIMRRNASLKISGLYITVNTADGTSNEIELTKDNLDDFTFNYSQEYFEADEEKILANIKKMKDYEQATGKKSKK